ncbi:MAG TPA: cytochrome D1 domain-containing protein [Terracidiphilus sp.]|nr:cytochrome D1 domain-containing protein [Terracidiphilus sp.]
MSIQLLLPLALLSVAVPVTFAQHGRLLVAQKGDRSLAIVDPAAGAVLASVEEGGTTGHEVAGSPDGRLAIVPIYGNSGVGKPGTDGQNIVVIDIASQKIVGNIQFDHGVRPHCPVFGPKDGLLYVTTELDHSITIIDPKTWKVVGSIPTGQPESHMFTISHDGLRGYTANVGPGTVSVLDITARKTLAIIPISGTTQRISISNDDRWVFTADQTKPQMAVIDTATNKVKTWVPLSGLGYGAALTTDGHWLLMPIPAKNVVDVVDLATMKVAHTVEVGADPQEVLARPGGKVAYVSCLGSNYVAEIDLATWKVSRHIVTGKGTDGLGWAAGH